MKRNHKISQAHDVDYHIMKAYRTKMSKNVLFSTKLKKNQNYSKTPDIFCSLKKK